MATFISRSPDDTLAFARDWSQRLEAGCRIGLLGDLGAGKTLFVRGLAMGLGVRDRVHSPTFALMAEYAGGRVPLVHVDLYRLPSRNEVIRAGIEDSLFRKDAIVVVEWVERYLDEAPGTDRRGWTMFRLEVTGDTERRITHEHPGA